MPLLRPLEPLCRLSLAALVCLPLTACHHHPTGQEELASAAPDPAPASRHINGRETVPAGATAGRIETINGDIEIGDHASVTTVAAVNGRVSLGSAATARSIRSVNGDITIAAGSHVDGSVGTVNGRLQLAPHAVVTGDLANVNGAITLQAARVDGGISTVNGDVTVGADAYIGADLHVEQPHRFWLRGDAQRRPRIVIGPGARIRGVLRFDRPVSLWISDRARVGQVLGATAQPFQGEAPPR